MTEKIIQINVTGTVGVGKSTIAFLLADFLNTTGFHTELNLLDELDLDTFEDTFTEKLEAIENSGVRIIINEVQTKRLADLPKQ